MSSNGLAGLSTEERALVETLREVPESPLRDLLKTLVGELARFAAQPACAEMQADGAPCASAQAACDECRKMTELLEGLRTRLQAS
jgi:hypothetical protein